MRYLELNTQPTDVHKYIEMHINVKFHYISTDYKRNLGLNTFSKQLKEIFKSSNYNKTKH